jgi:cobalt-zinc-cadmium efflux system membrane fusion protein
MIDQEWSLAEPKMTPIPRRRRIAVWVASLVGGMATVLAAAAWNRAPAEPAAGTPGMRVEKDAVTLQHGAPQWQVLKLGAVTPANTHWTDPVPARVVIDETRASRVSVPLSGRVTNVFVELGQNVKEGDPLFSVASPEIAQLRAEKDKSSVDLEAARTALERVRAMVASRALPAKEELAAERDVREAEVASRLAGSKLESLRVSSRSDNEFTVTAPRAGVVVEKNVLLGQAVSPDGSGSVMVVADLSSVWVVADLFDMEATGVREGTDAQVTSPALPEIQMQGRVEMVSSVVDPNRHTVPIRVRLGNADRLLRPNIYARVRFATSHPEGTLEIPATALVTDGDRQFVYVQTEQGRFQRRAITAGSVHDGRVPVLAGLKEGEIVVEEGAILLDNQLALSQ